MDYTSGPSNEVIWRPNFEELIRRLRHKVIKLLFVGISYIVFAYSITIMKHLFLWCFFFLFKACVEMVKERRDEGCANVMKAMLEVGRSQEKKAKTDKSGKVLSCFHTIDWSSQCFFGVIWFDHSTYTYLLFSSNVNGFHLRRAYKDRRRPRNDTRASWSMPWAIECNVFLSTSVCDRIRWFIHSWYINFLLKPLVNWYLWICNLFRYFHLQILNPLSA